MDITETLYVTNRKDWRAWLKKYAQTKKEIWLLYYKKHTNIPTIPYDDAVEEALCFGWIDSTLKRIDDEKHVQRYTPRHLSSLWSQSNITRAQKMIDQGKMTASGLDKFQYAMNHKKIAAPTPQRIIVPQDVKQALQAVPEVYTTFSKLNKSNKHMYMHWITTAKHEETRQRRINKLIHLLNKKTQDSS